MRLVVRVLTLNIGNKSIPEHRKKLMRSSKSLRGALLALKCTFILTMPMIRWVMGFTTYITECLRKDCFILKVTTLRREKFLYRPGDHPVLDLSTLLTLAQHPLYHKVVGMAEWAVQMGRFDIRYALTSLNRFSAAPMEGHLSRLVRIFGSLQSVSVRRKCIIVSP